MTHEWKHLPEVSYCIECGEELKLDDSNWDDECQPEAGMK